MPRKLLSSRLSFFYKVVFPILWIFALIFILTRFALGELPLDLFGILFMSAIFAANFGWITWFAIRMNRVEADDVNFYVSNFGKEIVIPRADLFEATEMRWVKPYWITLHLRRPSEFGDKIVFIPQWRMGAFWTANPRVDELNASRTRW